MDVLIFLGFRELDVILNKGVVIIQVNNTPVICIYSSHLADRQNSDCSKYLFTNSIVLLCKLHGC